MCNIAVLQFFIENASEEDFSKKRILEVGSRYVNGSVRPLIEGFCQPSEYVGIDLERGKYVDLALPVEKMVEYFGPASFDVVVSTELLEHCRDWRSAIDNMKRVLKPEGIIYLTCRSRGFPYHGFPHDFWRYEISDMKELFNDFEITVLESDSREPGVFLKARKPLDWKPVDLSRIELYSMVLGRRTTRILAQTRLSLLRKIKAVVIPEIIYKLQVLLGSFIRARAS